MKIRADFVTNSSSSSFVAYGIYDEEIKQFVLSLLNDTALEELKRTGQYGYSPDYVATFTVIESGLSIDSEIGNIEGLSLNINWCEEDEYNSFLALSDGTTMLKTPYIIEILKRFMRELSSEEENQLKKLINQSKKEKLIQDKVYVGATDDPIFENTFNENSAKKRFARNEKRKAKKAAQDRK